MPYSSIAAAKAAGFPTTAEGAPLTLAQINKLSSIYDAVSAAGQIETPMAVAWTQWKKMYRKEGNKWVTRGETAESAILTSAITGKSDWIPVAAPGQQTTLSLKSGNITLSISAEALQNNLDSWNGGYINVNHEDSGEIEGLKIESAKYEKDLLWFKVEPKLAEFIRNRASSGRSIEIQPLRIVNNEVLEYSGLGLSVLFPPYKPACSHEMGCSSHSSLGGDNIDDKVNTILSKLENILRSFKPPGNVRGADEVSTGIEDDHPNMEENMTEDIDKLKSAKIEAEKNRDEALKEIITLKSSIEKMSTSHKELEEKLKSYQEAERLASEKLKEDQWNILKSSIPPGKIHKPEDEAKMKQEFIDDPASFAVKMASWKREEPLGQSGTEYPAFIDDQEAADFAELTKMNKALGRLV